TARTRAARARHRSSALKRSRLARAHAPRAAPSVRARPHPPRALNRAAERPAIARPHRSEAARVRTPSRGTPAVDRSAPPAREEKAAGAAGRVEGEADADDDA